MTDTKIDWITDKIISQHDAAAEQVVDDHLRDGPGSPESQSVDPDVPPVPVDPEAEREAFAELLAFASNPDDGDADTVVTALTADEFDAAIFTPAPHDSPDQEA